MAVTAAAVLAVTDLTVEAGTDRAKRPRAADGASEGRAAGAPAEHLASPAANGGIECVWTPDITSEVGPQNDIGRPPVPDAALVMERCHGEWTGSLAWLVRRVDADAYRRPSEPPMASACSRSDSADAFLPGSRQVPVCNPIASRGRGAMRRTPGAPDGGGRAPRVPSTPAGAPAALAGPPSWARAVAPLGLSAPDRRLEES